MSKRLIPDYNFGYSFPGSKKLKKNLQMLKPLPVKCVLVFEDGTSMTGTVLNVQNASMEPNVCETVKVTMKFKEI